MITTFGILLALAAPGGGPYVDSQGNVYHELPSPHDYADFATFDALFGHEVFTNRDGHRFQIDRELTDEELAYSLWLQEVLNGLQHVPGGGATVRATVRTHHPVDEEYRGQFATTRDIRIHVVGEVERCDDALQSQFGIDFVPSSGCAWDSQDNGAIDQLLDEAYNECGGLNGQDMMIALTAQSNFGGAIGVGYIGLPRQLTTKYFSFEAEIMQHEAGHNYTLFHCCDNNCIMQSFLDVGAFGNFHNYQEGCSGQNHFSTMQAQSNRY